MPGPAPARRSPGRDWRWGWPWHCTTSSPRRSPPGTLFIGRGGTREVSPMRLSTAMPIETRPRYFTPCAQCGDALLAPEWSEHVNERCVRHLWTCETCGYQFETT